MALFKIFKGLKDNLPKTYNDGYCYVTIDDGKMYIDTTNTENGRIVLNASHADTATMANKLDCDKVGTHEIPIYFDGGIPTACNYNFKDFLPLSAGENKKLTGALGLTENIMYGPKAPESGFEGQLFFIEDNSDPLPKGGKTNQVLVKNSETDGDASWQDKAPAAIAADKLTSNAGSSTLPVYFSGGVPVATGTSLAVSVTGNAATATELKTSRIIGITDNSGEHAGTSISFNGSANKTLKLPTTIGADIIGNVTGNVTGNAASADKLTVADTGNATVPTYFSGGIPTACTSLSLNTTGSATKWTTARNITISDADATNSGDPVALDGDSDVTLKLPSTIKASLSGKATSAGTADSADKLSVNAGSSTLPVYFSGGVPVATGDSLDVNITKNAATATKLATARALAITDADGTNEGTGFNFDGSAGGTFKLPATIKANITGNISGNAASADKLNVDGGDSQTPVYFSAGVPTPCTSLSLDTTGNAATATNVAWSGVTSKPSYYDAKAIKSISRSGTTFTATHLDGTTSTFDQQDNNSDTNVTQTVTTANANYPLLLAPSGQTVTTTATSYFDSGVTLNPSTNTIAANISGNAATATKLAAAQTISLTGDVTGSASFTGNSACTITATVADNSHNHTNYLPLAGGTMNDQAWIAWPDTGNWSNSNAGVTFPVQHGGLQWTGQSDWIKIFSEESTSDMLDMIMQFGDDGSSALKIRHSNGTDAIKLSAAGRIDASAVYGAVWNDYAEYRTQKEEIKPGYCVASADNGQVYKTTEKFQACDGIVSDTFGFAIGETDNCKTPLAVAGRVLAYCEGDRYSYHSGDTVCAGPGGKVVKMTREEIREWPDRIIGIVSEIPEYETWGTGNVAVDGRIWIKVK